MKIKKAEISGFGRWSQQTFDFSDGFQAIVGQNESGKSTLRAFIIGVLFGFPTKKGQNNVYDPKDGSKYGGSLVITVSQNDYKITRISRTQSELTITDLSSQTVIEYPEEWLSQRLLPLTRASFDDIFNFSQRDLAQIAQLKPIELQKLLLNIGAVGSTSWLDVANDVAKQSDKQFAQRSTGKRPLNLATRRYEKNSEALHDKNDAVADYVNGQSDIELQQKALNKKQSQILDLSKKIQDLQYLMQQYTLYKKAMALKETLTSETKLVSDGDIDEVRRLAIMTETSRKSLQNLNEEKQQQSTKNKQAPYDQSTIANLEVENHHLQNLEKERAVLINEIDGIRSNFKIEEPKLLTDSEKDALSEKDYGLIIVIVAILFGAVMYFIFKPALILAALIAGLGYFFLKQHRDKQSKIRQRYGMLSITEINAAQSDIRRMLQKEQQISELDASIDATRDTLVNKLEPITDFLNIVVRPDDLEMTMSQLMHSNDQWQLRLQNNELLFAQRQQQILTEIQKMQSSLLEYSTAKQAIFKKYQVQDSESLMALKQQATAQLRKKQRFNDMMQQIKPEMMEQLQQIDSITDLQEQLDNVEKEYNQAQQAAFTKQAQLSDLQAQQQQRTSSDQFLALQQELANEQTMLNDQFGEYLAERLTVDWINRALQAASQNRFPKMQKIATQYFTRLTQNNYIDIQFVKDDLSLVQKDGHKFGVSELSTGTQEQLYVALRLALSQVIADIVSVPLLIDDGFVNFDDDRRAIMLDILQEIAQQQQIFYFTTAFSEPHVKQIIAL